MEDMLFFILYTLAIYVLGIFTSFGIMFIYDKFVKKSNVTYVDNSQGTIEKEYNKNNDNVKKKYGIISKLLNKDKEKKQDNLQENKHENEKDIRILITGQNQIGRTSNIEKQIDNENKKLMTGKILPSGESSDGFLESMIDRTKNLKDNIDNKIDNFGVKTPIDNEEEITLVNEKINMNKQIQMPNEELKQENKKENTKENKTDSVKGKSHITIEE